MEKDGPLPVSGKHCLEMVSFTKLLFHIRACQEKQLIKFMKGKRNARNSIVEKLGKLLPGKTGNGP